MADVYDALDLKLERPVAVKLLRPEMAVREDVRLRFQVEARAAAGLTHPNAVAVFDTGEHEGLPYLVMERLPGKSLADSLTEGPIESAWLCEAAAGVLGALAEAHAAGIVHRDVKPGNILISADGRAKITDFGIAKSVGTGGDTSDLTRTGHLVGTPAYLAPERLEGHPASPRSDLFALGVVLYEALAGRKPFQGDSPLAVARAVADGEHVPLLAVRPDLDPGLIAAVERAMAHDPEDRFASAEEMAATLTGAPPDPTLDAFPAGTLVMPAETADAAAPPSPAPLSAAPLSAVFPRRRLALLAAVAALILLVLFLLTRAEGASGPEPPAQAVTSSTAPAVVQAPQAETPDLTVTVPPGATGALTVVEGDEDAAVAEEHEGKGGGKGKGKSGKG